MLNLSVPLWGPRERKRESETQRTVLEQDYSDERSPKRETHLAEMARLSPVVFARPPSPGVETERGMSEANVEIIRRHYELKAEAFRGGDVRASLEIAGPEISLERPRPAADGRSLATGPRA